MDDVHHLLPVSLMLQFEIVGDNFVGCLKLRYGNAKDDAVANETKQRNDNSHQARARPGPFPYQRDGCCWSC